MEISNEAITTEITAEITDNEPIDVDQVMSELATDYSVLPVEAIRVIQQHREQFIPRLIHAMEDEFERIEAGKEFVSNGGFFAFFLLLEFNVKEAFPVMVRGFSLPEEGPFEFLGDGIHDLISDTIYLLSENPLQTIDEFLSNPKINMYVAWQAANCYLRLVKEDVISKEEAVGHLRRHLQVAIEKEQIDLASSLVCELDSYASEESIEQIREAFRKDLADETLISLEEIEENLMQGDDSHFQGYLSRLGSLGIEDTVQELKTWASFQKNEDLNSRQREEEYYEDTKIDILDAWEAFQKDADQREAEQDSYEPSITIQNEVKKVGRNSPCPCGSGRKHKKCCGAA